METRKDTTANWENDLELLRSGSIRKYKTKDQPTHPLYPIRRSQNDKNLAFVITPTSGGNNDVPDQRGQN